MDRVWSLVTDHYDIEPALQTQALLALGAMARRVRPSNHGLATQIVADLHHLLEQHTGVYTLTFIKQCMSAVCYVPIYSSLLP